MDELYQKVAKAAKSPIVVFNGELDRIRSGYYPPFVYPKLGRLAKSFIPNFESAYYIHNFKGSRGGELFLADLTFGITCILQMIIVVHSNTQHNGCMTGALYCQQACMYTAVAVSQQSAAA